MATVPVGLSPEGAAVTPDDVQPVRLLTFGTWQLAGRPALGARCWSVVAGPGGSVGTATRAPLHTR